MSPNAIPSLPDIMRRVEHWMEAETRDGGPSERLEAEVNRVLDYKGDNPDYLFMLIAYAAGCHTVAEECRRTGHGEELVYHFFGQTMLSKAVEVMGNIAVTELRRIGEVKH